MRMNSSTLIVAGTVLAGIVGGGWWLLERLGPAVTPAGIIAASGRIETREIRVAATSGGRILELAAEEGDSIEAGALIATLDSRNVAATESSAAAAFGAALAGAQAASRHVTALERRLTMARMEAERYRRLFERDAAPLQAAQQAETAYEQLSVEIQAARSTSEMAARQADAARAQLEMVRVHLDEMAVRAPVRGIIRTVFLRAGEIAAPGAPIVSIGLTGAARMVVYLPLSQAEAVRPGMAARVYGAASANGFFEGVVTRVSNQAEFTPRDVHMPDERTTLVFFVEIDVPDSAGALKDGFPADAWIRYDPSAPWPVGRPW